MGKRTFGYITVICLLLVGSGTSWGEELGDQLSMTFVDDLIPHGE